MEIAHQYFEIEVPQHLKATELVPIVVGGEAHCSQSTVAAQLCGAEVHDSLRSAATQSPLRSSGNRSHGSALMGGASASVFGSGRWCPRSSPGIYFHPTCHFVSAAAMFKGQHGTQQAPRVLATMSAHILVASHTSGVGLAGPRAEVASLTPLFLLPHATVMWNTKLSSWQHPSTVLVSLCNMVSAARVANAHLSSAHSAGWEKSRSLLLVVHDDATATVVPHLSALLRRGEQSSASSPTTGEVDDEEQYQQLMQEENGEDDASQENAQGRVRRISVQRLLQFVPGDQRLLLESAFGAFDALSAPQSLSSGVFQRFVVTSGQMDEHRVLVDHVMAAASSNVHRSRSALTANSSSSLPQSHSSSAEGGGNKVSASNHHPARPLQGLPTAVFLSRYFAECTVRAPNDVLYRLPFLESDVDDRKTTHKASAVLLKRLQAEFAVLDALSDLERAIVQNLSTNATWLALVHQAAPLVTGDSKSEENEVVVAGTSSAPSSGTLDALCQSEVDRIFNEYFNTSESDPRTIADYRTSAEVLIDELKRDAARRSAEAQRAHLQQKLLERLDAVTPLLEKLLAKGRFVHST